LVDILNISKALEHAIGIRSTLIDISGLDEGAHQFEDLELFLRTL
jgi:hypothetical protein